MIDPVFFGPAVCPQCGASVATKKGSAVYCSASCKSRAYNARKRNLIEQEDAELANWQPPTADQYRTVRATIVEDQGQFGWIVEGKDCGRILIERGEIAFQRLNYPAMIVGAEVEFEHYHDDEVGDLARSVMVLKDGSTQWISEHIAAINKRKDAHRYAGLRLGTNGPSRGDIRHVD